MLGLGEAEASLPEAVWVAARAPVEVARKRRRFMSKKLVGKPTTGIEAPSRNASLYLKRGAFAAGGLTPRVGHKSPSG